MPPEWEGSSLSQLPLSQIRIATVIPDQDFEALVVATALSNNWQIIQRAFDFSDINLTEINFLVTTLIHEIPRFNGKTISLTGTESAEEITNLFTLPSELQTTNTTLQPGTGKNFALSGLSGGVGTTTVALNLAFELADRKIDSHLVDYSSEPTIAPYLGLRELRRNPNQLHSHLMVSQANFSDIESYFTFLQNQINHGVNSIFDFGVNPKTFLNFKNIFIARLDLANNYKIMSLVNLGKIPDGSWLILNQRTNSNFNKKLEEQLMKNLENSPFRAVRTLPFDAKAVEAAQSSYGALIESAGASALRRAIKELARELIK